MQSVLVLFALFFWLAASAAENVALDSQSQSAAGILPQFEGYSIIGNARSFALIVRRGGKLVGQGWLSIGESIDGFRLESFDLQSEVLSVRNAQGVLHRLLLPAARVDSSKSATDTESRSAAAKAKALGDIADYRKRGIEIFGPANVIVDTDGSLLPESRRQNYAAHRAKSEAAGKVFLPVNVDGRWYNTFTPATPPAGSHSREAHGINNRDLTPEDVEEIRWRWITAKAEFMGRNLAAPPGTLKAKTSRPVPQK